ncbi:MAG: N-acetylmuramoyl-L-alanine amidase [Tumebacillaceae bacterium]
MKTGWKTSIALTALAVTLGATLPLSSPSASTTSNVTAAQLSTLDNAFAKAAHEFGVPKDLLMAISYSETHWHHNTTPSDDNGFGLMHLKDNGKGKDLGEAANGLGLSKDSLKQSAETNIRGGAYLLAQLQKGLNKPLTANVNDWYEAVAAYQNPSSKQVGVLFADEVYRLLKEGVTLNTDDGGKLSITSNPAVAPDKGSYTGITYGTITPNATPDEPGVIWNPAYSGNYQASSRPTSAPINYVVIHDTEGSYSGTISWFQDPTAQVSAHYVVRSSDGQITQMVQEKDIAWHARSFNTNAIGVEHEGYESQTGWYTDAMYQKSAKLVHDICVRYNIPMDRDHILAHSELWGNDHTDPGQNWDWNKYMTYVTGVSKNWSVVQVDDSNFNAQNSGFTGGGPSQYLHPVTGYGIHNQLTYTNGNGNNPIVTSGTWKPTIPTTGNYEVKVFIPSNYAATTGAKYVIHYNGGTITKTVNQSLYSNQWVSLGTYNFAAGTTGYVTLGDNTGDTATVAFDAMKFMGQ